MKNKLAHFFTDADLRCSHDGLWEQVLKKKIKVNEGDFVVFMNASRTIVKVFCGRKEMLLHYKDGSRVLDPGIIPHLPAFCGGGRINMDGAVGEHLREMIERRKMRA
jgi:hypothetical protein